MEGQTSTVPWFESTMTVKEFLLLNGSMRDLRGGCTEVLVRLHGWPRILQEVCSLDAFRTCPTVLAAAAGSGYVTAERPRKVKAKSDLATVIRLRYFESVHSLNQVRMSAIRRKHCGPHAMLPFIMGTKKWVPSWKHRADWEHLPQYFGVVELYVPHVYEKLKMDPAPRCALQFRRVPVAIVRGEQGWQRKPLWKVKFERGVLPTCFQRLFEWQETIAQLPKAIDLLAPVQTPPAEPEIDQRFVPLAPIFFSHAQMRQRRAA